MDARRRVFRLCLGPLLLAISACGMGGVAPDTPTTLTAVGSEDCSARTFVQLRMFQPATAVIGQPDLVGIGGAIPAGQDVDELDRPPFANTVHGPARLGCGSLWIADSRAHRVLRHPTPGPATGSFANLVLGQPDFTSAAPPFDPMIAHTPGAPFDPVPEPTAINMYRPAAVVERDGMLLVCDRGHHRLLIWHGVPTRNGQPANVALGQRRLDVFVDQSEREPTATTFIPSDCAVVDGRLFVADARGRVLVWNQIPVHNDTPADLVLGQPDFTTLSREVSAGILGTAGCLWTDGTRLVVGDSARRRVLIWNQIPGPGRAALPDGGLMPVDQGPPADLVLGQPDFVSRGVGTSSIWATAIDCNGTQLAIADGVHNRVLVWNAFPTENGQPADVVLGQADHNHTASDDPDQDGVSNDPLGHSPRFASPQTLDLAATSGVRFIGDRLYVADTDNERIVVFESGR